MLNGLAPFLVFKFPLGGPDIPVLSGIPLIGDIVLESAIPIPLYLDEKITGICLSSQEKATEMDTQPALSADGKTQVRQRGVSNTVTVNFVANKDALLLSVLLAFADQLFVAAVNGRYSVSYFNGATLIFDGLVHSFQAVESDNDDLIRISMVIQKTNQQTVTGSAQVPINPVGGTISGPGV